MKVIDAKLAMNKAANYCMLLFFCLLATLRLKCRKRIGDLGYAFYTLLNESSLWSVAKEGRRYYLLGLTKINTKRLVISTLRQAIIAEHQSRSNSIPIEMGGS